VCLEAFGQVVQKRLQGKESSWLIADS